MRLDCPGCHKIYKIPEERLPYGKKVSFHCPSCKRLIRIDQREEGGQSLKQNILMDLSGNLPSLPAIVLKAQEVISNPSHSLKALANVVALDQALANQLRQGNAITLPVAAEHHYPTAVTTDDGSLLCIAEATVRHGQSCLQPRKVFDWST